MSTSTLLAWCTENHIRIDSSIRIVDTALVDAISSSRERALSVYSCEDLIECDCTLVDVPKTAVLSVKSCFFSQHISSVPYGHGAHLSLALALYGECLLGTSSRWFGYLQSLPRETVDIAVFWGIRDVIENQTCTCPARGRSSVDDTANPANPPECSWCAWLYDSQNASEWLKITEVDREQLGLMEEIRQYYSDVVEPTIRAASVSRLRLENDLFTGGPVTVGDSPGPGEYEVSFPGFCRAYSLVSTRAFWVDAYHGLAMVPVADAFNHIHDNHVQMESDYDVCVECGSLAECEHDREIADTIAPQGPLPSNLHPLPHDDGATPRETDYLEMRTVRPIPPSSEVFNTYGPLPNATLLSRYGFMLSENEHDTIQMVFDPLSTMRRLFNVRMAETSVGEDDHAVTAASGLVFTIRNACRERERYGQGIEDNEAAAPLLASVRTDESSASRNIIYSSEDDTISQLLHTFTYVAGKWNWEAAWDERDDGLVFNPPRGGARAASPLTGDTTGWISCDLLINSDGKISHKLWLFCILVALFAARVQFPASFGDLIERTQSGLEAIGSLIEFKARLINVQGYVERLRHLHDGDSLDGGMEGYSGNHGSTSPPLLPHQALSSLGLDYDTESDEFAQPATTTVQVQPRLAIEPGDTLTSITAASGTVPPYQDSFEPRTSLGQTLGSGPRNPEIQARFSSSPVPSRMPLRSCHSTPQVTEESYLEMSLTSIRTDSTGYVPRRDRSRSAASERPLKRIRRNSYAVVANRQSGYADRFGGPAESTREARWPEALDASDGDDHDDGHPDVTTGRVALLLARTVVDLCQDRYRPPTLDNEQRGIGMSAAQLGDVLDETPDWMYRTRKALLLAISERSIVESCAACWSVVAGR